MLSRNLIAHVCGRIYYTAREHFILIKVDDEEKMGELDCDR